VTATLACEKLTSLVRRSATAFESRARAGAFFRRGTVLVPTLPFVAPTLSGEDADGIRKHVRLLTTTQMPASDNSQKEL
jgi:hypothetical protein